MRGACHRCGQCPLSSVRHAEVLGACHALAQGLGFPQLSNMRTLPVFFNMIVQGLMDAPTFAVYLNPNPAAEPAGEVQFGGMNSARFTGAMNWTPVVQKSCARLLASPWQRMAPASSPPASLCGVAPAEHQCQHHAASEGNVSWGSAAAWGNVWIPAEMAGEHPAQCSFGSGACSGTGRSRWMAWW